MRSGLFDEHLKMGARMTEADGWDVPEVFTSFAEEYAAARAGAVIYDSSPRGRLRLTGSARIDFLHRMSTNELNMFGPGQGAATVLTTPIARIIDRVVVYARQDDALLLTSRGAQALVANWLRKYIFFNDDVQVRDASAETGLVSIYGPMSADVVSRLVGQDVSGLSLHAWLAHSSLTVARVDAIAGDGFHVFAPVPAGLSAAWQAALAAGAVPIGEQALETLRIESGLPRFARELSEAYIPLEVGLWQDVSFSKGCYIGQEIIARMESRQRLAKQMVGLRSDVSIESGADIAFEGEPVGKVSSAAPRPGSDWIGLGFVKPAAATPGLRLSIGADRAAQADVVAFPIP